MGLWNRITGSESEKLKAEIDRLRRIIAIKARSYRERSLERAESFKAEIASLQDEVRDLEDEVESLQDSRRKLEKGVIGREVLDLINERKSLKNLNDTFKKENSRLSAIIEKLNRKLEDGRVNETILKKEIDSMREGYRTIVQSLNEDSFSFDEYHIEQPDLVVGGRGIVLEASSYVTGFFEEECLIGKDIERVLEGGMNAVLEFAAYQEHNQNFEGEWNFKSQNKDGSLRLRRVEPLRVEGFYLNEDAYRVLSPYGFEFRALYYSIELKKQSLGSRVAEKVVRRVRNFGGRVAENKSDEPLPEPTS